MALDRCADEIRAAIGRAVTPEEARALDSALTGLERKIKAARAEAGIMGHEAATLKAADDMATDIRNAAIIEKRNAALNLKKRIETEDYLRTVWADDPVLGLEAVVTGVNAPRAGSRFSAAAQQNELRNAYLGGFVADLEKGGLVPLLSTGTLDREVARALYAIDNPAAPKFTGPKEAQQIAEVIHKWQETTRLDANRAGAWIGKLDGYITRQSHDIYKIRAVPYKEWRDYVLPRLDPKTFDGAGNPEEMLQGIYNGLSSGVHLKDGGGKLPADVAAGFRNIGKGLSQERVLHFKDADAWSDYNERFGRGNLREAVIHGLMRSGEATGLMRALGPNAEMNFWRVYDDALQRYKNDPAMLEKLNGARGMLENRVNVVTGATNIPGNAMGARVSSNVRVIEGMAKLGGALLASVTDVPVYASEMKYQGRTGYLSGMAEAIGGLMKGRPDGERREVASMIGVFAENQARSMAARFSAHDDLGGRMSRLQQLFFKLNGLSWWTETLRSNAGLAMSHQLAVVKGKGWGELGDLQRTLRMFGFDEGKWDILRSASAKLADGEEYVVSEAIRGVPDDRLRAYLESKNIPATDVRIRDLRTEMESQLRAYFTDRAEYAVLEPDARTRAVMLQGTQPGTVTGEFWRFIGQFKSFPVAFTQKVMGREVYGRGSKTILEAMRNGNGEMVGLAQLIGWTTLFGYGAMAAKDMVKGRNPRDPLAPGTWAAAMMQGGGLGIFGDFMLGETNRFGGGFLSSLAGPTFGLIEDAVELKTRLMRDIKGENGDAAAFAFRTLINNTPFLNLFYTRVALDYMILYGIQEALNPGSLRRMERTVEKENNQTFWLQPSQDAVRF